MLATGTRLALGDWMEAGCGVADGFGPAEVVGAWLAFGATVGHADGDTGADDGVRARPRP